MASFAHRPEVGVVIRPAVLEGDQMINVGLASAHGSTALVTPHGVPQKDPRPSGSPIGGLVVGDLLRRPGRHLHPLGSPGGDSLGHHSPAIADTSGMQWWALQSALYTECFAQS
jgi:hypothetical protein